MLKWPTHVQRGGMWLEQYYHWLIACRVHTIQQLRHRIARSHCQHRKIIPKVLQQEIHKMH